MQNIAFKLKQASVVLGVSPKDLQNLVQLGVIRPARRRKVCWFDTNALLEAKVALYLKESLGSSSELLARFTEAFSQSLNKAGTRNLKDVLLRSRPANSIDSVEIRIPVRSLARELESQIPLASAFKDLPRGRKRSGWKNQFLASLRSAAKDLGELSEQEILKTVRESRVGRKKLPEITIVARSKTKTA